MPELGSEIFRASELPDRERLLREHEQEKLERLYDLMDETLSCQNLAPTTISILESDKVEYPWNEDPAIATRFWLRRNILLRAQGGPIELVADLITVSDGRTVPASRIVHFTLYKDDRPTTEHQGYLDFTTEQRLEILDAALPKVLDIRDAQRTAEQSAA